MSQFSKSLLNWYTKNSRDLPWRRSTDPYAIWVSEIMLQQTRVETVIPYYQKWMQKYPDVHSVSRATEREILLSWEGLGYYRRAINLRKAAQLIVENYEGIIPNDIKELNSLPGIGIYTANAIASIAFQANLPAVDGNIERIISRVFDIKEEMNSSSTKSIVLKKIIEVMPTNDVGEFNQALMDLGATVCKPKNPNCKICPINVFCISKSLGIQNERPTQKEKIALPKRLFVCAIVENDNQFLIVQRDSNGLLGGMWEYPNTKIDQNDIDKEKYLIHFLCNQYGLHGNVKSLIGKYKHTYTHFNQIMYVYRFMLKTNIEDIEKGLIWTDMDKIALYPMGKIFKNITNTLVEGKNLEK